MSEPIDVGVTGIVTVIVPPTGSVTVPLAVQVRVFVPVPVIAHKTFPVVPPPVTTEGVLYVAAVGSESLTMVLVLANVAGAPTLEIVKIQLKEFPITTEPFASFVFTTVRSGAGRIVKVGTFKTLL
jgi:hypothetical protein